MKRTAAMVLSVLALWASLGADERQSLVDNSPFGVAAPAAAAAPAELEFRGVVQEEGVYLVNIYNPASRTSQWLPVSGKAAGLEVKSYDASTDRVQVTRGGRTLTLSLKQARVTLAGNTASLQLVDDPGPASPEVPEFMRNLPPDARQLLQDVRRRRALRPPFPGTEAEAVPPGRPVPPAR